jgi:hypothetical protein
LEARRQQQEEAKNVEKLRLEVQKSKDEVRRLQIDN